MGNTIVAAYIEPSKEAPCFEDDLKTTKEIFQNDTITEKSSIMIEDSLNTTSKARALSVGIEAVGTVGNEKEARG